MKTPIGLLLILLVTVCNVNGGTIPNFKADHVYVYDYEGRVATGISENDLKYFSGFGMKSKLKVYTKDDKLFFKFDETKVGRVNKRVDDFFEPLDIHYALPENINFEENTEKQKAVTSTIAEMERPFAAVYEDGVFKSYYDPDDKSGNWRKAVVGLFQTQFHPAGGDEHSHFYKVNEDGVGGKCKTIYNIAHIPTDGTDTKQVLNVTKVRLYDECESRPYYFYSSMFGHKCTTCNQDYTKPLKIFGRVEYQIKGNRNEFTIEKVSSTGSISFTPFTTHGQTVLSVVNQTLALVSGTDDVAPFEVALEEYKKVDSLAYTFYPETVNDAQEIKNFHHNRVYKKPIEKNAVQKVVSNLRDLVKTYKEGGKTARTVMSIIYGLSDFEYDCFIELCDNLTARSGATEEEKAASLAARSIVYEVLPYIGTTAAIKYMLKIIENHTVDKNTASDMMLKFPSYVKEFSPDLLDTFEAFLEKDEVNDYLKTWNSGILAFGTLLHKACVKDELHPHTNGMYFHHHPELCTKHVKTLRDKFYAVSARSAKAASVYLDALLNTYHPDGYEVFLDVVKDKKYPVFLRSSAIWGLERFAGEHREEVAAIIAPIYFDPTNDYVMRIYAFEILVQTFATSEFFTNLILSLETESNKKVASYIFSHLETIANTTDPCFEDLTEKARYVLQHVKAHQDYDVIRHAHTRIFSSFNAKYRFGRRFQYGYIPSENTLIPRELYMTQSINLLGYDFEILEVGMYADEDNPLSHYPDYFAPGALKGDYERHHNDQIKDIVSKLHLDEHHESDSDGRYEIYVRMFGHMGKFTQKYDHHESNELVIEGNKLKYNLFSAGFAEVEYIIPNEMGFPVVLSVKVPTNAHFGGSATIHPRPSEGVAGHVDVDAQFSSEFHVNARMYVYTPNFSKYGYTLTTDGGLQFPIKGSLDVDTHTKKFALKYIPSTEPYEIFHYDTTPAAIFPEEPHTFPIKYSEQPIHKEYKCGHDYLGVGLKYDFEYSYAWNDYGSYRDFLKSFFHKGTRHEDHFFLADKWFAGTRGLLDYAIVNPSAKPFHLHVTFEPSSTNPTTEFVISNTYNHTTYFEEDKGHDIVLRSLSVVGHGPVERRWDAELSISTRFPESDYRKVVFHFERSPIPNHDEKKFEIHYRSDVTYVNYLTVFTEKPEEVSVKYNGKLTIGSEATTNSREIIVKMLAEQTDEHKQADKTKVWFYKKCQEDREHKAEFTPACWEVMKDAARIDRITFDFEFRNIPVQYKIFANRLYSWFRHTFYNNLHIDYLHGSKQQNHVNLVANFSYHYPVFDLKITRPDQTVYYNKVYAPSVFPKYEPFNIAEDADERYTRKFFDYQQARCYITGEKVLTFDGHNYQFNEESSKCYHLVMGDCKNHHLFIFVKKLDTPNMDKAIKIYFYDDVIEAVPDASGQTLELYLNGEKKEGFHGFIFPVTNHPNYKLTVSYWGKGMYIQAKDFGVDIFSNGGNICILPNNFYRGKQCGLCGDLDGETHHDLKKPDGTPVSHKELNRYYQYSEDGKENC